MKSNYIIDSLIIVGLLSSILFGCKKDDKTVDNTVKDIDGNVYHTVLIGTQTWMVENLKVTKFRNGEPIPLVNDNDTWNNLTTGAYCNYENNSNNSEIYGRLYNWYLVNDNRGIAPNGWHIPTQKEWKLLIEYLGGEIVAGGKLKEEGTTHWSSPNEEATNEVKFTALPGGNRTFGGEYMLLSSLGIWWSSSEVDNNSAYAYLIYNQFSNVLESNNGPKGYCGCSVRCIKD